jgi:hypothetical protein
MMILIGVHWKVTVLPARALPTNDGGLDLELQAIPDEFTSVMGPIPSALNAGSQENTIRFACNFRSWCLANS